MTGPDPGAQQGSRTRTLVLTELPVRWWVLLVLGVVWLVFGMLVLQFDLVAARSIALAAGLLLVVASISQLVTAQAARGWRWMHGVPAAAFFVGGMIALVWPDPTLLALARLVAWLLLVKGCADLVLALAVRAGDTMWWLLLIVGLFEIAVAFWAAGVPSRSPALLMLWIALTALAKGITDLALAFGLRPMPLGAVGRGSGCAP
jgi:uncharacterized membrane protein HdeD (DUF308 family)